MSERAAMLCSLSCWFEQVNAGVLEQHDRFAVLNLAELDHVHAPTPLVRAWESWAQLLLALQPVDARPLTSSNFFPTL